MEDFQVGDFDVRKVLRPGSYPSVTSDWYAEIWRLVEVRRGIFRRRTVRKWTLVADKWLVFSSSEYEEWAEAAMKRIRALDVPKPAPDHKPYFDTWAETAEREECRLCPPKKAPCCPED